MKRNLVLLSVFLISSAINGAAQAVFGVGGQSRTVRREGLKELVGTATLLLSGPGGTSQTIAVGSAITLTFNTTIANASSVTNANVVCTPVADCGGAGPPFEPNISVAATNTATTGVLTITFKTASTFFAGDVIGTAGLRVNANAVTPGSPVIAFAGAITPVGGTTISFQDNPGQVAQVSALYAVAVAYSAGSPTDVTPGPCFGFECTGPVSILTCIPPGAPPGNGSAGFTINLSENFAGSLTSLTDESAPPNSPPATVGSNIQIAFTNIPKDVTVFPLAPVPCPTKGTVGGVCGFTFTAATSPPGPQTATTAAQTLVFTYALATTNVGVVADIDFSFQIGTSDASLPTGQVTPSVAIVSLVPTDTADTPQFTGTEGSITAINISDCITYLLLPWVTNFQVAGSVSSSSHFDTGIAIANTTTDPFGAATAPTGGRGSALPQNGNCVLTMFPNDGSASVTVTEPSTGALNSGMSMGFTASSAFPGKSGYVAGWCNFQNAHAFVYIVDNAGLGPPKTAASYLGLIIPNPALFGRNPAGGGFGEALNN